MKINILNKKGLIKYYQWNEEKNVGDTLTKPLIEFFLNKPTIWVPHQTSSKLLGAGSLIQLAVRRNDWVWGTGLIWDKKVRLPPHKILALRGKLTAKNINADCNIFGDTGLLMSLVYNPQVEKVSKLGIIEHFVDEGLYKGPGLRISVRQDWKDVVTQIKSCEEILSSSLHGLVLADSYGIKCKRIKLSDNLAGGDFKFKDYLSGTNRQNFEEPFDLQTIQLNLKNVLLSAFN